MPTNPEIFATTDETVSEESLRSVASDLAEALGQNRLLDCDGEGAVFRERAADYDLLPDTLPRTECILRVRLCTPYYGKGYERGCWPEIAATLEFLRRRLPSARVWYGPDGTEVVQEVTCEFLDEVWDYWAANGGRPYYKTRKDTA